MAALPLSISIAFAVSLVTARARDSPQPALDASGSGLLTRSSSRASAGSRGSLSFGPKLLELSAIDVSQGDSLLLVFPDGETMLVDAGGFPGVERMARKPQLDIGEDVVSPYLWSRRIRHLDYAVLTHGHSDHMGGLAAILDNFRPRALWIGAEPDTQEWKNIRAARRRRSRAHRSTHPRVHAHSQIGGTHIRVLAPSPDYVAGSRLQ